MINPSRILKSKAALIFAGFAVLFLIVRLAVLCTNLDGLYESEELYRGTVAREILLGSRMPLGDFLDYSVEYFPGGTLVVGYLAVPFFLLFGQTYISLKLVGLLFALGTFAVWYYFLKRFFGNYAAYLGALLFIFSTPFFTKISLITWGAHPEANFFAALSILIFYLCFWKKESFVSENQQAFYAGTSGKLFLLGLVFGFSAWFVQTSLISVFFIFLIWFALDPVFFARRGFRVCLFAAVLGYIPGLYYFFIYGKGVLEVNGGIPLKALFFFDLAGSSKKLIHLLCFDLPHSAIFEDVFSVRGPIVSYAYYFIFLGALGSIVWRGRRSFLDLLKGLLYSVTLKDARLKPARLLPEIPLFFFFLVFVTAYSLSDYAVSSTQWECPETWMDYIGYRYMIPLAPFLPVFIAVFLFRIRSHKLVSGLVLSLILFLGIIGNFALFNPGNIGKFNAAKGYSYDILGDKIGLRVTAGLKQYLSQFNSLDEMNKAFFYRGLGSGIAWRMRNNRPQEIEEFFSSEVSVDKQALLYKGWGRLFSPDYPEEFSQAVTIAAMINSKYRSDFYQGFGKNMGFFTNPQEIDASVQYIRRVDEKYQDACFVGLGNEIGFRFKTDPDYRGQIFSRMPKDKLIFVESGLKEGMDEY